MRELGIRPSIFVDVGALFNVRTPILQSSPYPGGIDFPLRNQNGELTYAQINVATLVTPPDGGTAVCTPGTNAGDVTIVTNPVNPNPPACVTDPSNILRTQNIAPFQEVFLGNSASPRIAIGVGANWNSPFGPLRIDVAHVLRKQPGDDVKTFTFNVGTQF